MKQESDTVIVIFSSKYLVVHGEGGLSSNLSRHVNGNRGEKCFAKSVLVFENTQFLTNSNQFHGYKGKIL